MTCILRVMPPREDKMGLMEVLSDKRHLQGLVAGTNKRRCLPAFQSEYSVDAPAAQRSSVGQMNVLDALMVHVFAHRATIWVPILWEHGLDVVRLGTYLAHKLIEDHGALTYGVVHHKKQEILDVIREYCYSDRAAVVLRNAAGEQVFYAYCAMGKLHMHRQVTGLRILCDIDLAKETLLTLTSMYGLTLRRKMVVLAVPGDGAQLRDGVPSDFADMTFTDDVPAPHDIGVDGLEGFLKQYSIPVFSPDRM